MRTRSETKSIQMVVDGLLEEHDIAGANASVMEALDGWTKVSVSLSSKIDCEKRAEIAHTFHEYFSGEISKSPYVNQKTMGNEAGTKFSYIVRLKR